MKELLLISIAVFVCGAISGQTFSEWFRQKKTQIKYLKEQIVAFKAYQAILKKGYALTDEGLTDIGGIKQGDLDLHSDHFESLKAVKGSIRNDPRVQAIRDLSSKSLEMAQACVVAVGQAATPGIDLKNWVQIAYDKMVSLDGDVQSLLTTLITDGDISARDDERLMILERLYRGVQMNYRQAIYVLREVQNALNQTKP